MISIDNQWIKELFDNSIKKLIADEFTRLPDNLKTEEMAEALNLKLLHALLECANPAGNC